MQATSGLTPKGDKACIPILQFPYSISFALNLLITHNQKCQNTFHFVYLAVFKTIDTFSLMKTINYCHRRNIYLVFYKEAYRSKYNQMQYKAKQ